MSPILRITEFLCWSRFKKLQPSGIITRDFRIKTPAALLCCVITYLLYSYVMRMVGFNYLWPYKLITRYVTLLCIYVALRWLRNVKKGKKMLLRRDVNLKIHVEALKTPITYMMSRRILDLRNGTGLPIDNCVIYLLGGRERLRQSTVVWRVVRRRLGTEPTAGNTAHSADAVRAQICRRRFARGPKLFE